MIAAAVTMHGVSYNEHVAILSRAHFRGSFKTFGGIYGSISWFERLATTEKMLCRAGDNGWHGRSCYVLTPLL